MTNIVNFGNKQQKHILSAKKRPKENIRNVLANPYSKYWPQIHENDCNELKEILTGHLPKLKEEQVPVPLNIIKQVPKEKRKAVRLQYRKTSSPSADTEAKNHVVLGVNAVTKHLENNNIASVLISGEVSPRLMVQHVIDLAVMKKVPVLVVPGLKELLQEITGIASLVLGLKESYAGIIRDAIKNIASNYPVPDDNSNKPLDDDGVNCVKEEKTEEPNTERSCAAREVTYLRRDTKMKRVFVPPNTKVAKMDVDFSNDFISFDNEAKYVTNVKYQSLKVKRVRSNKDRPNKKSK